MRRVWLVGLWATVLTACSVFLPPGSSLLTAQIREESIEVLEAPPDNERVDFDRVRNRTPQEAPPRTVWDGKPDFSGVYHPYVEMEKAQVDLLSLYKPEVKALQARLSPEIEPDMHCYPNIWPMSFRRAHPIQVFHAPGVFIFINEVMGTARITPIVDGPPRHDPSLRPSFQGDSIGYWDGDTLVISVTNFNGLGWLWNTPLSVTSPQLRVVERWTRLDSFLLEVKATAEDPTLLTGSWTFPTLRRGKLSHDFSSFDPCVDDSVELASHIKAHNIDAARVKLTEDVLLSGAAAVLEREAAQQATR